jgi:hypothetical protein
MGPDRRIFAGLLAATLAFGLTPGLASAQTGSCGTDGCQLQRTVAGDYWAADFDVTDQGNVQAGSQIELTLSFDQPTDRTGILVTIEDLEDGHVPLGLVVWVKAVRDEVRVYHEPIAGGPVDVDVSPVGELAWDQLSATIQWNVDEFYNAGQHRIVATGPTADGLDLELALDGSASFQLGAETSGDTGGSLVAEEAWQPSTMVDAPELTILRDGAHELDVPDDRRLYGYQGPATGGAGAYDACFTVGGYCGAVAGAPGTNYGYSTYGLERPDGSSADRQASWPVCTFATCPDGPGNSAAFSFVADPAGAWTFTVDEHHGVGTAPNMILLGAPIELP